MSKLNKEYRSQPIKITVKSVFVALFNVSNYVVRWVHQYCVDIADATTFNIGKAVSDCGEYTEGGIARLVKVPFTVEYKSLPEAFAQPEILDSDFAKMERPRQYHYLWRSIGLYRQTYNNALPLLNDKVSYPFFFCNKMLVSVC